MVRLHLPRSTHDSYHHSVHQSPVTELSYSHKSVVCFEQNRKELTQYYFTFSKNCCDLQTSKNVNSPIQPEYEPRYVDESSLHDRGSVLLFFQF